MRAFASAMALTVAVAVGGLVLTDTLRLPGGPGPVLADSRTRAAEAAGTPADPTRPLTPDDPLRLWIAGDSLAGSLGPSLGEMTAESGVVQPVFDSRVSSGLESEDFFDWPEHATDELARLDPEAIAFVIGTNDAKIFPSGDGWQDEYAQKVEAMMALLVGNGRDVYWVGVPTLANSTDDARAAKINTVFQDVADGFPDVTYVDAYTLFSDSGGDYASSLPDEDGDTVTMRAGDGVHLSAEGGDLMARAVFYRLDATWDITGQAVPDQAKEVIQTPGSSQIQGTYRAPSSSSSSGGATSPTTTTVAPEPAPTTTTVAPESTSTTTTTATTTPPDTPDEG